MKEWSKKIEINAPIEAVWDLLNGSLENMQKIMPQVIENTPLKVTDNKVGSVYMQKYQSGKRISEYEVETLEFLDTADEKALKVGFNLGNTFEITTKHELVKVDENTTTFTYTTTNRPLKWFMKFFLLFAGDRVVVDFVQRVKNIAESESTK